MTYSKEFRREAIKLSDEIGVKKAASQLGIPYYTLADWRYRRNGGRKVSIIREPMSEKEKDARIAELEKANAELERANEILKDALGFFAKDRKK